MEQCRVHIAILEPSPIIYEGLSNLLLKLEHHFFVYQLLQFDELNSLALNEALQVVIVNPALLQNRVEEFQKIKKRYPNITWLGLVYSFYDSDLLSKFNDVIMVTDSVEMILQKIKKSQQCACGIVLQEELSEREIDVLIQMVKGLSNKEIADVLYISIHTVISHRKNIAEKTGIKSLSGLTIYAITKKIIPLDTNI